MEARLGGVAVDAPGSGGLSGQVAGCPSPAEEPTRISASVERIEGSRWNDVLIGDTGPNTLLGRDGDDKLEGFGGSDILVGGAGRDRLSGASGFDCLFAADGARDRLIDCGEPSQGIALIDPGDPRPRHCTHVRSG